MNYVCDSFLEWSLFFFSISSLGKFVHVPINTGTIECERPMAMILAGVDEHGDTLYDSEFYLPNPGDCSDCASCEADIPR